jgi:hypothetical protein
MPYNSLHFEIQFFWMVEQGSIYENSVTLQKEKTGLILEKGKLRKMICTDCL